MIKNIVILGPAHPYRGGGITTFNERLATELQHQGYTVTIYNFSLQYPSFLFPGKSQYSNEPAPGHLNILRKVNSINPLNWLLVGNELKQLKPDLIIVRFWIPLMGPALGSILRRVKKNRHTKIVAITDNIIPHEKRPGDKPFTKYFLKACDAFITMSEKVLQDLKAFEPNKPVIQIKHPLYDNFGTAISLSAARTKLGLPEKDFVILFFGFIRHYKGLDLLLEAIGIIKQEQDSSFLQKTKLLVAGEFYEEEEKYQQLIDQLAIREMVLMKTGFIEDKDVKNYFCAADLVIQPYRSATQSGVTPLAYHFEKPMIVTNVGALPDYVPDGIAGIVCEPNARSIANAIEQMEKKTAAYYIPSVITEKKKYSWTVMVTELIKLTDSINH